MKKWLAIGIKIVPLIMAAIRAVETLSNGKKGKTKQDAAVEAVRAMLPIIEGAVEKDLLDDEAVQRAVRNAIDAIVSLQNVIAAVKAARDSTPTSVG